MQEERWRRQRRDRDTCRLRTSLLSEFNLEARVLIETDSQCRRRDTGGMYVVFVALEIEFHRVDVRARARLTRQCQFRLLQLGFIGGSDTLFT